jgi:hypothetical protein
VAPLFVSEWQLTIVTRSGPRSERLPTNACRLLITRAG